MGLQIRGETAPLNFLWGAKLLLVLVQGWRGGALLQEREEECQLHGGPGDGCQHRFTLSPLLIILIADTHLKLLGGLWQPTGWSEPQHAPPMHLGEP